MKNFTILLILLFVYSFGFSQTTIYSEDFTGQLNKGAYYDSTTGLTETDLTGVNWTIDIAGVTFDSNPDKFQVIGGARFLEARDLDGPAIWYSPTINISAFTDIQFSLDATENSPIDPTTAAGNLENTDTLTTEYSIDGGPWTQAGNNGFIQNDYLDTVVSHNVLLNGTTLELRVTIVNNGEGERMRIDNILVEGTAPTTQTITINPSTNTIAALSTIENNVSLVAETFSVQGNALTNDITISTPAEFIISTVLNGPYVNTITLPQTGGIVNSTTIYTKLAFGLAVNNYSGNISVSSTGATTENVAGSGTVLAHTPAANCGELLISEYHEADTGTPNEQYIELYNPTSAAIDLSNYQIARFRNGRVNWRPDIRTIPAGQGTIAPLSTFLIARNGSTLCSNSTADYCTGNNVMAFDGNDVIALQNSNGINIDVVGVLNVNNPFGQDIDLARNPDIQAPTVTYNAGDWVSSLSNNTSMLGYHINDCQCPNTTRWQAVTGWDNGMPNSNTAVILETDYTITTANNITACSLTINPGVILTINQNSYLEIENDIINNGTLIILDEGSVVQNNDLSNYVNGTGAITEVEKFTASISAWYEYTYWSSPVQGEQIGDVFTQTNGDRRFYFNAANLNDADANGADDNANDWQYALPNDVMQPGVGYACTMSQAAINSLPPGLPNSTPSGEFQHRFFGPLNNGVITTPVYRNDLNANFNTNIIGNPYASAIDVGKFFQANVRTTTNGLPMDGVIYLWSHNSPPSAAAPGNSALNFPNTDYAIINYTGGTASTGTAATTGDGLIPNGFIPSGQGFVMGMSDDFTNATPITNGDGETVHQGEVIFNNDMRVTGNNDQFFRTSNDASTDSVNNKLWLNLESDNGVFSQILVGYLDPATDADDGVSYDAIKNTSSGYAFMYSKIAGNDKNYGIQGKAKSSITLNEEITLGVKNTIEEATLFTISIAQLEGEFFNNNKVYLEDSLMNSVHDLSINDYTFTSEVGEFNDRFKIVFNPNTLSINNFETAQTNFSIIELENNDVKFSFNGDLTIKSVKIIDALGRELYNFRGSESTEIFNLSNLSNAAYIAQVELSNGLFISKKAIKK